MKNKGLKITILVILIFALIGTGIYLIIKKGSEIKEDSKHEIFTEEYVQNIKTKQNAMIQL